VSLCSSLFNRRKRTEILLLETITAKSVKGTFFRDVTPYNPVCFHRRIEGIYRLHLQARRVRKTSNQQEESVSEV
jgi:hypothetical protein